ncbi:MAG: hypothetical protein WCP91_00045 [Candidatus Berkelbacteria bacterium]
MTTEDYNLNKLILDAAIGLLGLLIGGGAGIFIENKLSVVKKFKQRVSQKGSANQANSANGGSAVHAVNTGENTQQGAGIQAVITDSQNTTFNISPRTADEKDALTQTGSNPDAFTISQDVEFICAETKKLFEKNGRSFNYIDDYARAEDYRVKGQHQNSATLYIRIYSQIADLMSEISEDETADGIKQEITKLTSWNLDAYGSDDFDESIKKIQRQMYSFYAK